MKRTYQTPRIEKRGMLSELTAEAAKQLVSLIASQM